MSLDIYPVFKPKVPEADCEQQEILARVYDTLDSIAAKHKLVPLSAFADNREISEDEIPEDFAGDPDELDEVIGPWDEWFEPKDGIAAFRALADLIRKKPAAAKKLEEAKLVVKQLDEFVRVLQIAENKGARFRLEMR